MNSLTNNISKDFSKIIYTETDEAPMLATYSYYQLFKDSQNHLESRQKKEIFQLLEELLHTSQNTLKKNKDNLMNLLLLENLQKLQMVISSSSLTSVLQFLNYKKQSKNSNPKITIFQIITLTQSLRKKKKLKLSMLKFQEVLLTQF